MRSKSNTKFISRLLLYMF